MRPWTLLPRTLGLGSDGGRRVAVLLACEAREVRRGINKDGQEAAARIRIKVRRHRGRRGPRATSRSPLQARRPRGVTGGRPGEPTKSGPVVEADRSSPPHQRRSRVRYEVRGEVREGLTSRPDRREPTGPGESLSAEDGQQVDRSRRGTWPTRPERRGVNREVSPMVVGAPPSGHLQGAHFTKTRSPNHRVTASPVDASTASGRTHAKCIIAATGRRVWSPAFTGS